jgi:hypothetical protein
MPKTATVAKAQPKPKESKAAEAIRSIWFDSRKRPKAYRDRFVVPSEGE